MSDRNSAWPLTPERVLLAVSTALLAVLTYLATDLIGRVKASEARDIAGEVRDADVAGQIEALKQTVGRTEAEVIRLRDKMDKLAER